MVLINQHLSQEFQFQILIQAQFFQICILSKYFHFSQRSMQVLEPHPRQFLHAREISLAKLKLLLDGFILICEAYVKILQ